MAGKHTDVILFLHAPQLESSQLSATAAVLPTRVESRREGRQESATVMAPDGYRLGLPCGEWRGIKQSIAAKSKRQHVCVCERVCVYSTRRARAVSLRELRRASKCVSEKVSKKVS